jgi:ABC-type Na+ efflux pump permease subunit
MQSQSGHGKEEDVIMKSAIVKIMEDLHIIWTIAWKDIKDALTSKLALASLFTVGLMVLMPKLLPLIIDPPFTSVVVYDANASRLLSTMEESDAFDVRTARSVEEVEDMIGDFGIGLGPEVGLVVPDDFDQALEAGEELELEGYLNWTNRNKASNLLSGIEGQISELMGKPVSIELVDHYVYPELTSSLLLGIMTTSLLSVVILMGILLVPNLIFDEKQSRTMDALLVSPANIGQVVLGKVLAGWFYMILTAGVVFLVNWTGVVHWGLAILFTVCSGLFSIALGLVLGSFFEAQQEVTGWMSAILVILLGAVLVGMMGLEIPAWLQSAIPWVPSVTLSDILRASFSGNPSIPRLGEKLASLFGITLLLYAVVVWKIRRSDR